MRLTALSLSEQQVIKWTDIYKKYESDLKDKSKAYKTMRTIGKELEATLTEDQLKKFKEMQPKKGPHKRGKEKTTNKQNSTCHY